MLHSSPAAAGATSTSDPGVGVTLDSARLHVCRPHRPSLVHGYEVSTLTAKSQAAGSSPCPGEDTHPVTPHRQPRIAITRRLVAAVAVLASVLLANEVAAQPIITGKPGLESAERLPWSAATDAFSRRWMVLGPLTPDEASARTLESWGALVPTPGLEQKLPGGRSLRWLPRQSWEDVVDFSDMVAAGSLGHTGTGKLCVLAWVTFDRPGAGDVVLSLGHDQPIKVWLNGKIAADLSETEFFAIDQTQVTLAAAAGANNLMLRIEGDTDLPMRLAFRVHTAGRVVARVEEISPFVVAADPDAGLHVRTDRAVSTQAPPVQLTVHGPGGRIVGQADTVRGAVACFDTNGWAHGPYEVRCTTATAWGGTHVSWLPWYKGDARTEVQRLIRAADKVAGTDAHALTVRVLADIVRDRAGHALRAESPAPFPWQAVHACLMEFAELELEKSHASARIRSGGFYRLARVDDVDGSPQFARAYLPIGYDPTRRWPVVINLHGFNPGNPAYPGWWSVDRRHSAEADRHGVIVLEPHGRGNAQYQGIGEHDVISSLDQAVRLFSVDEERVAITGNSMGGAGTWLIGSRHAHRFAAIAPVFGGWDFRVAPPSGGDLRPVQPRDARQWFRMEQRSSFAGAEMLAHTPVFIHHGDSDDAVSVENSRFIVRMLQRWGYPVRYREMPGRGHEELGVMDDIVSWFQEQRRASAPRQVRVRATDLRGASAHWLRIDRFTEPQRVIVADATMVEPGMLRLDTDNVDGITLRPSNALLGPGRHLRVVWNDREVYQGALGSEGCSLQRPGSQTRPVVKRPGIEGPISDVIRTPFIVVVGTSSPDPLMRQRCLEKAEAFSQLWRRWQHVAPRLVDDAAISDEQERRYSLVLIGGVEENSVARRLADRLNVTVGAGQATIDGRSWDVSDAVVQVIQPHPLNPDRYVMLVAPTSADGLYFWNPSLWHPELGFPSVSADWIIQDGFRLEPGTGDPVEGAFVASGVFDAGWRRDDRWTVTRGATGPVAGQRRRAPAPGYSIAAESLERCAGFFEFGTGVYGQISRQGGRLEMRIMGGTPVVLHPESETEFANASTAVPVTFSVDAAGRVTEAVLHESGGAVRARKIRE